MSNITISFVLQPSSLSTSSIVSYERHLSTISPVELNPVEEKVTLLSAFKNIPDNWDGYKAKKPHEIAIKNAITFIKLLPNRFQKVLNTDEIFITPYGTITLDWEFDASNNISIEIGKSKIGFLSETKDGENPYEEGIDFNNKIPEKVLNVFNKVYS